MTQSSEFVYHVGALSELSSDYLPSWFVALAISLRWWVVGAIVILFLAALALPKLRGSRARDARGLVLGCALLQSGAMFLLALIPYHQIPDEVFVSLIQSRNLGETGRYSFYPERNVDGTGDGLFYVAVGGLHAAGVPAPLGLILLSASCAAAAIGLLYRHAFDVTGKHGWAWSTTTLASLLLCFGRLGGTGWSASLLAAITIGSILLWRSERWRWTFLLTGILPLCRYDFSFYTLAVGALLVVSCARREDRPWRVVARFYALSLIGVLAVLLFWRLYYGHFVPTCILMKAGLYASRQLFQARIVNYVGDVWPFLLVILFGSWFTARRAFRDLMAWIIPGVAHLALVAAGGGDYFHGNRYQIVLTVALAAAAVECLEGFGAALRGAIGRGPFPAGLRRELWLAVVVVTLLAGVDAGFRPYAVGEIRDGIRLAHRTPTERSWMSAFGPEAMTISRLNNHAFTGRFLSLMTKDRPGTRMASLEVASTFYFFDGVSLDVQGFVDRNVATGPRNPWPRMAWDKRLDPSYWERERPDIIWLSTSTAITDAMVSEFRSSPSPLDAVMRASRHWHWTEPYLDNPYLRRHYKPRATFVNGDYLILWLAREDLAERYDRRLAELGFTLRREFP